jgi:hypothetical protein
MMGVLRSIIAKARNDALYEAHRDAIKCMLETTERTNDHRVQEAAVLCKVMSGMTGVDLHDEDEHGGLKISESVIGDILAHLMHLCRVEGYDFEDLARVAYGNFWEEVIEEREEMKDE